MNDYYNLLNVFCPVPTDMKTKIIAYHDDYSYPVYSENTFQPVTQKAKSVINGLPIFEKMDLNKYVSLREQVGNKLVYPKLIELIQNDLDIVNLPQKIWEQKYPIFARPCPLKPRHGFVDSRIVSSAKELNALLEEVKASDPKGEILLMPFIAADYNAILCTSGYLSVGPGHDGATGGNNSVSFPVAPVKIMQKVKLKAGLSSKSIVFIEAVYKKRRKRSDMDYHTGQPKTFYITQLRGGPSVDAVNDFIPSRVEVKKIVIPHNDLLKWESETKKFVPGTVVYGKGHTLASHAAIHCVINKIPFITSFEPHVGDTVSPTAQNKVKFDRHQFMLGVTAGLYSKLSKRKMLHFAATVLHNWAYLSTSDHSSWLLGMAAIYISKILCALSYGEYRHCQKKPLKIKGIKSSYTRSSIYSTVMDGANFNIYIRSAYKIKKEFTSKEKFRRGFGGKLWADAVKHTINIWNAIVVIQDCKNLTPAKVNSLVSSINKSINLVHNNGWLFNKISEQTTMEKIANKPGLAALELADVFYEQLQKVNSIKKIKTISKVKVVA
jgi:hypothetical protein